MELGMKLGGISYKVEVDIDDDYVCSVFSVSVHDGKKYVKLNLTREELREFYDFNEDYLNEAYEDYKDDLESYYYESKLDAEREERCQKN